MNCRIPGKSLVCFFAVFLGANQAAKSAEYYYAIIFGSESSPKQLKYTHTWATYVKATGEGDDLNSYALEAHTISWYPATMKVKVFKPCPETGINMDLNQTLSAVYANNESVTAWGPFLIGAEVYERSLGVANVLNSGQAKYRAISGQFILIGDCVHAVAAVDPQFGRNHYPLIRIGKPASRYIAREIMMRSMYDQKLYDNSWLIPRLGLNSYPIEVVPPQRIPAERCGLCNQPD